MKPRLVVTAFLGFDRAVALQVTYIDESLRGKGILGEVGGFTIESKLCPGCLSYALFVRGADSRRDLDLATLLFATDDEKAEWIDRCKAAIRAINEGEPEQPTGGVEVWS